MKVRRRWNYSFDYLAYVGHGNLLFYCYPSSWPNLPATVKEKNFLSEKEFSACEANSSFGKEILLLGSKFFPLRVLPSQSDLPCIVSVPFDHKVNGYIWMNFCKADNPVTHFAAPGSKFSFFTLFFPYFSTNNRKKEETAITLLFCFVENSKMSLSSKCIFLFLW